MIPAPEIAPRRGLRIAHLSDLHFGRIRWCFRDLLCKRWLGNLNLALHRRRMHLELLLESIPEMLQSNQVDRVVISGDFTTTALKEEFEQGRNFVKQLRLPCLVIPGNHDVYTKKAAKQQIFYREFEALPGLQEMRDNGFTAVQMAPGWSWIGLDTTKPEPLFFARGLFSEELEQRLEAFLKTLPPDEKIVMANHYPLFWKEEEWRHSLMRSDALQKLVARHPQIKLYLHGHDHAHAVVDLEGYPLLVNCGSCSHVQKGTFFLIDLRDEGCLLQLLHWERADWRLRWHSFHTWS